MLLICLLVSTAAAKSVAQRNPGHAQPYFDRITTQQGLSDNYINALYRDSRGFLWIGTQNGLNEYDGRSFTVYRHNRFNPHSILANCINNIAEDDSGYLWMGTNEGICRLDPYSRQSISYRHDAGDPLSLNDNYSCHVYCDKQGILWVGNESGVSYYDPKRKRFIHIQILPDSLNKTTLTAASLFLEDKKGRFWIGTYSGLVLYNRRTHSFKRYILNPENRKDANPITALFEDHAGRIWVGVWGSGLSLFDPNTGTFKSYKWNNKNKYPSIVNLVFSVAETHSLTHGYLLWAATTEGLFKIDDASFMSKDNPPRAPKVTRIVPAPEDPHSLTDKHISRLYVDNQNILWIGTENGLNEYINHNQLFEKIRSFNGNINRIWVDSLHGPLRYFIATWYGNGLTELNENFQTVHTWPRIPPNATNPNSRQISDIIIARDGTIWIGTFNGLYSYNEKAKQFTSYIHKKNDENSLSTNKITSLAESKGGQLWIGTYGRGVNEYDPAKKVFTRYRHGLDSTSLCDDLVWNIYKDRQNQLWIATNNGISLLDEKRKRFINYTYHNGNVNTLQGRSVSGVVEDSDQIYWIATGKGLNRLDRRKGRFTLFASEEGLENNSILSLIKDNSGLLWMCDGNSISSFNPATRTFVNYDEQNGLPYKVVGVMSATPSGEIIVGGNGIIIKFNPSLFQRPSVPPPVYITDIAVSGRTLHNNHFSNLVQPLVLHYPHNNFSATFSAPEFFNGKAVKYAYQLDGIDAKWTQAGERNFVTYSGLPPGHYTLHVKAANSDGVWNNTGAQMQVLVIPPFWKTWWFFVLITLALLAVLYSFYRYRISQLLRIEGIRNKISMDLHDDVGSTLSSISILSDTALNSINKTKSNDALLEIRDNSRSLMEKMDDIVWSFNPKNDTLESLMLRIKRFASILFETKNIEYAIDLTGDISHLKISLEERQHLYLIVKEAVNNIVKHAQCSYVSINALRLNHQILISIKDNGKGFEMTKSCDGNGLCSMRQRAKKMNGDLQIQASPEQGTQINLYIKIK